MMLLFYFILAMMQANEIQDWQSVRRALYPEWNYEKNLLRQGFLTPPNDSMERSMTLCQFNSYGKDNMMNLELDLDARSPIPAPSRENLVKYQPRTWMVDAQEQGRADVLEFLLRNGLFLPAYCPTLDERDSELAKELCAHSRSQFVALYLLYEPIDETKKIRMVWKSILKIDLHPIKTCVFYCIYIYNRLKSGLPMMPEYDKYQGLDMPFYVY